MSKLLSKLTSFFRSRTLAGVDKSGNRYFTRTDADGLSKEKRWVIFKGEEEPTTIPVEWICWLNGQRRKAPTPEEMAELEARRERVRLNVALLKKEEEERISKKGTTRQTITSGKVGGPDLKSFIRQFPDTPVKDYEHEEEPTAVDDSTGGFRDSKELKQGKRVPFKPMEQPETTTEPTGTGKNYKPGTWQPPT
ncbi:hypothetical protein GIB67_027000 [Kingdonia uniflora]|uniref:NADH dehydrogenase [ubiquinone] 1 alpha subcomplex subunit 12 n=1 Tax=Kingdonia uniflora TaxID=39325 RepID=A0A7J7P1J9_9MAGN|nr:hypothetical protein GIB67_027000 [Kingdonia uniflora]